MSAAFVVHPRYTHSLVFQPIHIYNINIFWIHCHLTPLVSDILLTSLGLTAFVIRYIKKIRLKGCVSACVDHKIGLSVACMVINQ